MVAVVSVETLLLVVLVVLVAGLLRSHAEILRRLGPGGDVGPSSQTSPDGERAAAGLDAGARAAAARAAAARAAAARAAAARAGDDPSALAPALSGITPAGDPVALSFDGASSITTLLAFLTSGCSTCAGFWDTLAEPRLPAGVQTVIVTKGAEREHPAKLRSLAPPGIPVVMSSQAWADYRAPGAPYFVLVDGVVLGEGVATTWQALASLVTDAIAEEPAVSDARAGARRAGDIDARFAAAGIGPGDPSLRPGTPAGGPVSAP